MIIPSVLIHIPLYHSDKNTIGFAGLILMTIQCFIMIASIYLTEKALKNILMMTEHVDKSLFAAMFQLSNTASG